MRISVWSSDVCSSDLPRSEAWKYTPLRALERRAFAPVEAAVAAFDPALIADIPAPRLVFVNGVHDARSEEHTSELQSLMRISYAVFCLKKKKHQNNKKNCNNKQYTGYQSK